MWEAHEKRRNFIQWATPADRTTRDGAPWRIAVMSRAPFPGIEWVLFMGESDRGWTPPGNGAFYDNCETQPGGAITAAIRSARTYAARSFGDDWETR